ncbi:MAG: carboxy terminal-processing peptidase [Bacteroidota bacterium]
MKLRSFVPGGLLLALFLFSSYTLHNGERKSETILRLMMQGMQYYHYQPQSVDDNFASKVFEQYLQKLDYNKRFLTAQDVATLRRYEYLVDEEINDRTYELFDLSIQLYDKRLAEAEGYYREILAKPFDFSIEETLDTDVENMDFAQDEAAVKDRWRQVLKYQTLTHLVSAIEKQEKAEDDDEIKNKSMEQMEAEARKKVLKNNDNYFRRLAKLDVEDHLADYMNAITEIFDPHTAYFPPKDKENFDIAISGQLEGIGASLVEQDGYIKVVTIVPGSACSLQGDLEVGDLILKVGQGKKEPVDVVNMDIDDAIKMIRGPKGTEVRLTVRKIDNSEKLIPIIRDVVILEDTYARSFLLENDKSDDQYGYINLPKFYTNFNSKDGRRCATDVAMEIEKLKQEGIEGLIIDLRGNGGGSLNDVVEMAGLFIEKGPIVQVKSRDRAPYIMADKDPRIQYDGPLIIMVNSLSASASEILAAAIQDYDRGVIVGSESTFGKGTVQRFVNLDNFLRGQTDLKPLGELKLTTQKFYRIDGGATQHRGVIPDIVLPDNYSLLEIGEKEREYSMPWDEIEEVPYRTWENRPKIKQLRSNSKERVENNETFSLIQENAKRFKTRRTKYVYPLQIEAFRTEKEAMATEDKKFENIRPEIEGLSVDFLPTDLSYIEAEKSRKDRWDKMQTALKADPYVYESIMIMNDMK